MARITGGNVARLRALARVDPLTPHEAWWLVGLLEAEAHFYVSPNNGGANWQCGMTVSVRDDDADVLLELAHRTALGRLRSVPARRSSLPQARWTIDSRLETARLASLLRAFPPIGRHRHEIREWIASVDVLARRRRGTSEDDWRRLEASAARMKRFRHFTPGDDRDTGPIPSARLFLAWLGGFFTGEGSLMLDQRRARMAVRLRRDDRPLLESVRARLGIGAIYDSPAYARSAPSSCWMVFSRADVAEVAEVLRRAGLRGRKARQFVAWEAAVEALSGPTDRFVATREAFIEASRYVPPTTLSYTSRAVSRAYEAYVEVLQAFAAETVGPLTCTAFDEFRVLHPHWPQRNTIVRTFGSWAEALDAAELRDRAHARSAA